MFNDDRVDMVSLVYDRSAYGRRYDYSVVDFPPVFGAREKNKTAHIAEYEYPVIFITLSQEAGKYTSRH